jgi:hypothetical protein
MVAASVANQTSIGNGAGCLLLACFVAAVVVLSGRLPIYSTAKGSYILGLSPAFRVLAAAGCEPLLRWRWTRFGLLTILSSWAFAVHVAFCCVKF